MLFFELLSSIGTKKNLCHPLDSSTAATHHHHQPLMYPTAATQHGGWLQWCMLAMGGISGGWLWWVVAVGVRGWQQWWVEIVDAPPKKEKKLIYNDLNWSKMNFKGIFFLFFMDFDPFLNHPPTQIWLNPYFFNPSHIKILFV